MRSVLSLIIVGLAASCGPASSLDAGPGVDAGGCDAMGRTCDSVAGDYTLTFEAAPDGCGNSGYTPRDFTLGGFDGGSGTVYAFGGSDPVTRSGCALVVPRISSSPLSLTYEPACRELHGSYSCTACDGGSTTCRLVAHHR